MRPRRPLPVPPMPLALLVWQRPAAGATADAPPPPCPAEEDERLVELVHRHGAQNWTTIARSLGGGRNGKSCRLRWFNQLDPRVNKEPFTDDEVGPRREATGAGAQRGSGGWCRGARAREQAGSGNASGPRVPAAPAPALAHPPPAPPPSSPAEAHHHREAC
jgi:hypothetical protein